MCFQTGKRQIGTRDSEPTNVTVYRFRRFQLWCRQKRIYVKTVTIDKKSDTETDDTLICD